MVALLPKGATWETREGMWAALTKTPPHCLPAGSVTTVPRHKELSLASYLNEAEEDSSRPSHKDQLCRHLDWSS